MRILLVDDEAAILEITEEFLEISMVADVDTASSATEGLAKLELGSYDAVVSDYQMPGEDGIAFLKKLRSRGIEIPFILFTGKGREEVVIEALNSGADFYLQKGGQPEAQFAELENQIITAVERRRAEEAIIAMNSKLSAAVNLTRVAFWSFGFADMTIHTDDWQWATVSTDGTADDGTEMKLADYLQQFVHPDDVGRVSQFFEAISANHSVHEVGRIQYREFVGSGAYRWVEVTLQVVNDAVGNAGTGFGAIQDITEHKEAERTLRESEEKFSKAFHNEAIAMALVRLDNGTVIDANQRFASLNGYSRDDMIGRSLRELIKLVEPTILDELAQGLRDESQVVRKELKVRRRGGELWTALASAQVLRLEAEDVVILSVEDISERRSMELLVETEKRKMRAGMDLARLASWEYDALTGYFTFDDSFYSFLKTSSEKECGQHMSWDRYLHEFVHPDDRETVMKTVRANIESDFPGDFAQFVHRIVRKDGETRTVMVRITPIRDSDRKVLKTFGVNQDITEQIPFGEWKSPGSNEEPRKS
ncbi:MAG TPA: PAS domain S-box protein [Methanomassiliicoccales archaeon]|nr:PAS domain S-box protein [Methanomassiliicoccales archaeon]